MKESSPCVGIEERLRRLAHANEVGGADGECLRDPGDEHLAGADVVSGGEVHYQHEQDDEYKCGGCESLEA